MMRYGIAHNVDDVLHGLANSLDAGRVVVVDDVVGCCILIAQSTLQTGPDGRGVGKRLDDGVHEARVAEVDQAHQPQHGRRRG